MNGFKQSTKMSHGGHYCWGGKVMKKAAGGGISGGPTRVGPQPKMGNLPSGGISSPIGRPNTAKPINLGSTPSMKGGSGKPINLPIDLGSTPSMKGGGGRNPPALGQLPLDGSGGGRNPPALGKLFKKGGSAKSKGMK